MFLPEGRLAQLVRAPRLHRGGRRFEPCTAHQLYPRICGREVKPRVSELSCLRRRGVLDLLLSAFKQGF